MPPCPPAGDDTNAVDMLLARVDNLSFMLPDLGTESPAAADAQPASDGGESAQGKKRATLHRRPGRAASPAGSFGLEISEAGRVSSSSEVSAAQACFCRQGCLESPNPWCALWAGLWRGCRVKVNRDQR
jgi:hypothetical protein